MAIEKDEYGENILVEIRTIGYEFDCPSCGKVNELFGYDSSNRIVTCYHCHKSYEA